MRMALQLHLASCDREMYPVKVLGTRLSVQVEEWWSQHAQMSLHSTLIWLFTAPPEANAMISLVNFLMTMTLAVLDAP